MVGITLVFWPEFAHLQSDRNTALGALYTAIAVIVSAMGAMAAHRNNDAKLPMWQTMAWGMLYGSLLSLVARRQRQAARVRGDARVRAVAALPRDPRLGARVRAPTSRCSSASASRAPATSA
jgi:hypothetical protein